MPAVDASSLEPDQTRYQNHCLGKGLERKDPDGNPAKLA